MFMEVYRACKRKRLRYADLVVEVRGSGWQAYVRSGKIGIRGFVAKSATSLLV